MNVIYCLAWVFCFQKKQKGNIDLNGLIQYSNTFSKAKTPVSKYQGFRLHGLEAFTPVAWLAEPDFLNIAAYVM